MTAGSRASLDRAVANELAAGADLETQTSTHAVLTRGKKVNHVLHAILSVLTAGVWLIVWAILVAGNKRQRVTLFVNEHGEIERNVTRV